VAEFGEPNLLAAQGGVVSGLSAEEDEALVRIGPSAIAPR
jgi:hypothetical protein